MQARADDGADAPAPWLVDGFAGADLQRAAIRGVSVQPPAAAFVRAAAEALGGAARVVLVEEDPVLLGRLEDDLRRAGADPRRATTPADAAPGEIVLVEASFASVASRLAAEVADAPALVRLAPLSARTLPWSVMELLADLSGADVLIRFPQEDFARAGKFGGPLADFPPHLRRVVEGCSAFFADERHGWLLAWREAARVGGDEAALAGAVERLRAMLGNGGEERMARAARLEGAGGAGVHVLLSTPHPEHALELNGAAMDGGAPPPAPAKRAGKKSAPAPPPPAALDPAAPPSASKAAASAAAAPPESTPSPEATSVADAGPTPDAPPSPEAAPPADADPAPEAAPSAEVAPPADAGPTPEAASSPDAAPPADTGSPSETAPSPDVAPASETAPSSEVEPASGAARAADAESFSEPIESAQPASPSGVEPAAAPPSSSAPPAARSPRRPSPPPAPEAAAEEPPSLLDLFGLEPAPFGIEQPRGPDLRSVADDLYAEHAGRRVPFRELLVGLADAGLAPEQVRTALGYLKRDRRAAYRSLDADGAEVEFIAEPAAPPPPPAPRPRKARKPVPGVLGLFDEPEPEPEAEPPSVDTDAPLTLADAIGFEDALGLEDVMGFEDAGPDDAPSVPDPAPGKKPRRRKAE